MSDHPARISSAIDPLNQQRVDEGTLRCPYHGEEVVMLLRHSDVREAATDVERFTSDAPFRVPIPSEESVRTIRQLPIETDPPIHKQYRAITDPFFLRAKKPEVIDAVKRLVLDSVRSLITASTFDAVSEMALPIQSKALTHLLNVPESEARIWIDWGIHVFKVTDGEFKTGNVLEQYLHSSFDRGEREGGDNFFAALPRATINDRALTRDECMGFANLAFAGGRDTIIHTLTSILHHFAVHPDTLDYLREDPRRVTLASEEFFRVFMPLTQIGRVCRHATEVHNESLQADERIGLGWASANFDEEVFESPHEVRLDRRPNPHLSFGFRTHLCQGAPHARLVVRSFLETMCDHVKSIDLIEATPMFEKEAKYDRQVGFERLVVRMNRLEAQ